MACYRDSFFYARGTTAFSYLELCMLEKLFVALKCSARITTTKLGSFTFIDDINLISISRAIFEKIEISSGTYRYFPEDNTYTFLFREMVSRNYWNPIRIVGAVFKKFVI
jgi:hypothetical protein